MISAPSARSSVGSTDLTVAFVPTGMKAGVRTSPRRAQDAGARRAVAGGDGEGLGHAPRVVIQREGVALSNQE